MKGWERTYCIAQEIKAVVLFEQSDCILYAESPEFLSLIFLHCNRCVIATGGFAIVNFLIPCWMPFMKTNSIWIYEALISTK